MPKPILPLLILLSSTHFGCTGDKDETDTGSTLGGGDDGGDSGNGSNTGDGVSPTILEADAWCYEHPKSDATYIWVANASVDDPQGLDTMESFFDGVTVFTSDVEVANYAMVCDDGGDCTTSWNQNEDGIACSNAEAYVISIMVADEDDNWSEPVEVTGRIGSSAEG